MIGFMKKPAKRQAPAKRAKNPKKKYELGSIQLKDAGVQPKTTPRNFFWAY